MRESEAYLARHRISATQVAGHGVQLPVWLSFCASLDSLALIHRFLRPFWSVMSVTAPTNSRLPALSWWALTRTCLIEPPGG